MRAILDILAAAAWHCVLRAVPAVAQKPPLELEPHAFVSGTHDGVTPFADALQVADGIVAFLRGDPHTRPVVAVPFDLRLPEP